MTKTRKHDSPEFKLRAVVELLKGEKTAGQLAGELGVHPLMLSEWKKHFLAKGAQIFERQRRCYRHRLITYIVPTIFTFRSNISA